MHETDDAKNRVASPEADICQHAHFVGDETQEPAATLLEERPIRLHSFGLAESTSVHLDLVAFLGANHEQVSEPAIFAEMALSVVKEVVTLLSFVGEIVFGHPAEGGESKNGQRTGQASNSTAARFDRSLEKLAVDVLHILEKGDEGVLLRSRGDDTGHGQHILLASGLQFHLVHEVLNADLVEDTVGVDEQHEEVVVALEILGVNLVDELESPLLAVTLSSVGETRDSDAALAVRHIDRLGVRIEGEWNAKLFDGIEVEFVFLISIERKEDVQAGRRVVAVYERVDRSQQNLGNFLVARHDDDDFWR